MTKSVSYYKQYAKKCLIEGRTNTRGFENCFESGEEITHQVVKFLIKSVLNIDNLQKKFNETEKYWKPIGNNQFSISDAESKKYYKAKIALKNAEKLKAGVEEFRNLKAILQRHKSLS